MYTINDDERLKHPVNAAQTFTSHASAGAAAGMAETAAMYPVDTIKTRLQASMSTHRWASL